MKSTASCIALIVFAGCAASNTSQDWTKQGVSFSGYKVVLVNPVVVDSSEHDKNNTLDSATLATKLVQLIRDDLKKTSAANPLIVTAQNDVTGEVVVVASMLKSYEVPELSTGAKTVTAAALLFATAAGCITCPVTLASGHANSAVAVVETTLTDHQSGDLLARIDQTGSATRSGWSQSQLDSQAMGIAAVADALDKTAAADLAKRLTS